LRPFDFRGLTKWPALQVHRSAEEGHGTTIRASLNGQVVATVSDSTFTSGQMWLATGETPGAPTPGSHPTARFRNLVITAQ
jgi:hypothetical protein